MSAVRLKIGRVEFDLDDVWEQITNQQFADEIEVRAEDKLVAEAISNWAPESDADWGDERDEDEMFRRLDDWAKAELLKAIREDDGRRCIDVLKRAAA